MTPSDFNDTSPASNADKGAAGAEFARDEIIGGRYKVLSLLGKGGMGLVYRVEQIFFGEELALKTIHKSFLTDTAIKRFEQEARTAFAVNHANIIAVKAFGLLDDQTPFLAMEIVNGETLAELLQDSGPLPIEAALPIIIQVCFGLAHAHDCGIVHRDIKPSNIMILKDLPIGTEGSVKVLDFGIAKFSHREGGEIQALTKTGEIFGSPLYMSPEQCTGTQVDYRSDIYSLGCVIFEALSGKAPFVGNNALATLMMHQSEPSPSLAEACQKEDFPPELERIVSKMLAKQPEERYQNLGTVAHDLASIVNRNNSSKISRLLSLKTEEQSTDHHQDTRLKHQMFAMLAAISLLMIFIISTICLVNFLSYRPEKVETESTVERKKQDEKLDQLETTVKTEAAKTAVLHEIASSQLRKDLAASGNDFQLRLTNITGPMLDIIATAKHIENIDFLGSTISNQHLNKLSKLKLNRITLTNTNFDDLGAQKLAQVQSIRIIKANGTLISNRGLAYLKQLKNLNQLKIENTNIDINGVRNICQSKTLKTITLANCPKIEEAEQKLLQQEFPATKFEFEGKFNIYL